MADKSFGIKQLNLTGASGTPTIESPNNLNINAVTVAISTDVSIGGQVTSNIIVGTGKSVGIGSTFPRYDLDVVGNISITGTIYQNGSIFSSGVQGAQGIQGATGAGSQGVQGTLGAQGSQGVQGATGAGSQGVQGTLGAQGSQGIQGAAGAGSQGVQGAFGSTGSQGVQGSDGAQGVQGTLGAQGSQGVQGVQGADGSQGIQGATGTGTQGSQGVQGTVGAQGSQGLSGEYAGIGAQGAQGIQGAQGPIGLAGVQGAEGVGYLNVTSSTTLTPSVNSSAIITVNQQGAFITGSRVRVFGSGTSQYFEGTIAGMAGDPVGTLWNISVEYVYPGTQGSNWTISIAGDVGSQGIQGAQGVQGADGAQGIQGATGTGTQGSQGVQGAQGLDGAYAAIGYQGVQGAFGSAGTQGVQGASGSAGTQGVQGAAGSSGSAGTQGVQGAQGLDGAYAAIGYQGVQGAFGSAGTQGVQGAAGSSGSAGTQGVQGAAGSSGSAGTQGVQGAQGLDGAYAGIGYQGVQGAAGSTTLTVKEVASQGGVANVTVNSVNEIRFNNASGFNVTDEGSGVAFVDLGSTFNPWEVDGQTSLSASGEEPVEFIAGSGIVITTNNTSTPKSITFTASGGGGGGGSTGMDITLGTPTDSSLIDGLLSWTTSTKVTDAIDEMNEILNKLAPAKPSNLSAITLALSTFYSATETSTGTVRSIVTSSTTPQTNTTSAFYDGDSGTLSAWIDGSQATNSSRVLTTSDDSGTYGSLIIASDTDPYTGQSGKEGFWKQLTARILSASSLAVGSHTYQMKHSGTGDTAVLTFYIDNPATPTISSSSSSFTGSSTSYVSGVPTLSASTTFTVSFTINDAIKQFYNTNQVAIISGSSILSSSVTHQISGSQTNNAAITVSNKTCTVGSSKYSETNSLTITPYNSAGTAGTAGTLSLGARVDTVSSEGSRKLAGSGQYPSSGYGGSFDSTQSLKTSYTEELQLLNGVYRMPTGNYSSNVPTAGPDYSTGMGSSDRWYIYQHTSSLSSASAFTISINGSSGISNVLQSGMSLYAKVEGVTGWIDCNGAYPGSGSPSSNGDPAVVVGSSTATSRRITFGATPRSGTLYIRIGFPSGSTKSFSSISVSL